MVQYIDTLHDLITSIENEITTLTTALSNTEHVLYSTRQDLSVSRTFKAVNGVSTSISHQDDSQLQG